MRTAQKTVHPTHGMHLNARVQQNFLARLRSKTIHNLYSKIFESIYADTPELIEQAHRIRYDVFCLEKGWISKEEYEKNGQEHDEYDENTEHILLIYKPLNLAIGTMRLIKPRHGDLDNSFPLQKLLCVKELKSPEHLLNSCEFSRLCISRSLRQKAKEHMFDTFAKTDPTLTFYEKPLLKIVLTMAPLALFRTGFERAIANGLTNILGIMEPFHLDRLVNNCGLVIKTLSDPIEFKGTRQPFVANIKETLDHSLINHPDIWAITSCMGTLHDAINALEERRILVH